MPPAQISNRVCRRRGVREEVDIDRAAGVLTESAQLPAYPIRLQHGTRKSARTSRLLRPRPRATKSFKSVPSIVGNVTGPLRKFA